jgi:iron complex transport system ATP-binding protein
MEAAAVHHLADRPLEELSGGEKQRVVLAQALAQDAPVLLLDEPTTHLDLHHVVGILDRVRSLAHDRGRAVLAVFHDLNLASAYCDRAVALDGGRVVAEGTPEEVVTRGLLKDVYDIDAEVTPHFATGRPTVLLGAPLAAFPRGGLPRAHVVGGAGRGAPVMRWLAERGYEVTAGVLHAQDSDAVVAERLNLERVVVPPFSEVDEGALQDALVLLRRASVVVVCDAPYGPGNVGNLRGVLQVAEEGARVLLLEEVLVEERDFTGGEASRLWGKLREGAEVARSYEELLAAVASPG